MFLAEDPDAPTAPRWVNIRIMVDDVDALWEHVQALGISPAHAIGDRFYGLRDFKLCEPSAFEIRFAQAATYIHSLPATSYVQPPWPTPTCPRLNRASTPT